MPLHNRYDRYGHYYQYGDHGYKYYYNANDKHSKLISRQNAIRQGRAIHASKRLK